MRFRFGFLAVVFVLAGLRGDAQLGTVTPNPVFQAIDSGGVPLPGAMLYTCAASSSCPGTPQATYTDSTLMTQLPNPVVMDAAGRATIFLSAATYKLVLQTAAGVLVWSVDNVAANAPWNLNTVAGRVVYTAPTNLIIASNAITPINNVHTVDTIGGAVNLNTLTITGAVSSGFVVYLTPNNGGGNPVTVKTGLGNILLAGGDYVMDGPTKWISLILRGTTWYELARAGSSLVTNTSVDSFRLSLTSGTCVTTADVLAATTLYWTPCTGNVIALYDGTSWSVLPSGELSIAIPASVSQMYDVFVYNNSGTPALEVLAWTNDTTRATSLTTQNGVLVKTGAFTRRYVGSCRTTTVSGQTEDSLAKRYVWNYYNRADRVLGRQEAAASWSYGSTVLRQANANTANQVEIVVGVAEVALALTVASQALDANAGVFQVNIGEDSVVASMTDTIGGQTGNAVLGLTFPITATVQGHYPTIGRHFYAWLEGGIAATTFYGARGGTWHGNAGLNGRIPG